MLLKILENLEFEPIAKVEKKRTTMKHSDFNNTKLELLTFTQK